MKPFRHGGLMSALLLPALSMFTGVLLAAESGGLSEKDHAAGWKLLVDGKSLNGWRSYKAQDKPKPGWTVDEGILKKKKPSTSKGRKQRRIVCRVERAGVLRSGFPSICLSVQLTQWLWL